MGAAGNPLDEDALQTPSEWTVPDPQAGSMLSAVGGRFEVPTGVHSCCRFSDDEQRRSVVSAFVDDGLRSGQRVAVYQRSDATPLIDLNDPKIRQYVESGQLIVGDAESAYFPAPDFDGPQRAAEFAAFAEETVRAGYSALRVYADNGRMPSLLPDPDEWLEYEMRVAALIPRYPLIGLCGFSADDPPVLSSELIDAVHERNLGDGTRPSAFHIYGNPDGSFSVEGEIDRFSVDDLRRILIAAQPVVEQQVVSLEDVTFTDVAGAAELHQLTHSGKVAVVDVPTQVRRVWKLLQLSPAG
ncbi:MAG: MEDS domain-containing protein [Frankiales bacterium]|nr:MEDS domain-containing protein [Frankiales bacterium]